MDIARFSSMVASLMSWNSEPVVAPVQARQCSGPVGAGQLARVKRVNALIHTIEPRELQDEDDDAFEPVQASDFDPEPEPARGPWRT
jgi:hypothetical protein